VSLDHDVRAAVFAVASTTNWLLAVEGVAVAIPRPIN
jgi:hypothetical protein